MTATTNVGANQPDDRAKPEVLAKHAFDKVRDQFLKHAKIEIGALGPRARAAIEEVEKMLLEAAQSRTPVKSELILAGYQRLRHAHTRDQAARFRLGPPPSVDAGTHGVLPSGKRDAWVTTGADGRSALKLPAQHLLSKLLNKVGLDPKSLPMVAVKLIEEFGHDRKWNNLQAADTWKELGSRLRAIALDEGVTGGPRAEDVKRAMQNAQAQLPPTLEPGKMQSDLGLKKIATERANTGSASGATAMRAQLLAGTSAKAKGNIEQAATDLAEALLKELKVGTVSNGLKSELISTLKEALKDPSSPDGAVRPLSVLSNAYRLTMEKLPADHPKTSFQLGMMLADGLAQIAKGIKEPTPGLDRAFSEMAMWGLTDLATAVLGQPPQNASDAAQKKFFQILGSLSKNNSFAKALLATAEEMAGIKREEKAPKQPQQPKAEKKERVQAEPVDTSQASGAEKTGADKTANNEAQVRRAVRIQLGAMGVRNLDDPRAKKLESALTEVFKQGLDEPSFAVNGYAWLAKNTGLFASKAEHVAAQVPMFMENVEKARGLLNDIAAERALLESTIEKEPDKAKREVMTARLEQLGANEEIAHNMFIENRDPIIEFQNEALRLIAQFCTNETGFRDVYGRGGENGDVNAAGGGGAGGGGGGDGGRVGGGGGGGGRGGDDEPDFWRRSKPSRIGLPGIFSGGGPNDDPTELTLQQQRALKCNAILNDSSLSIEDKIFLFMMWFVAFTDREREKQLEDIVGMDSRQAARAEAIEKLQQKEKSQKQEVNRAGEEMRIAKREMAEAKALPNGENSPEYKEAAARATEAEGKFKVASERLDEVNTDIKKLERDHDSAPQSREVKFTELQRLSQLRDNILNMARSIMETSNRNIEKVFR